MHETTTIPQSPMDVSTARRLGALRPDPPPPQDIAHSYYCCWAYYCWEEGWRSLSRDKVEFAGIWIRCNVDSCCPFLSLSVYPVSVEAKVKEQSEMRRKATTLIDVKRQKLTRTISTNWSTAVCPGNKGLPVSNSARMQPIDQTSTAVSYSVAPKMSSGAR